MGGPSRWWRNRMGRLHSPQQIQKKIICMWNNSHRTTSEHWQRTPNLQKVKPISLEWGGAKDKDNRETKDCGAGTCAPGRESWRWKSSPTLGNQLTGRVRGSFRTTEGSAARQVLWRKMANIYHSDRAKGTSQPRRGSHTHVHPQRMGAGSGKHRPQGSIFRERTRVCCREDTLRWLIWNKNKDPALESAEAGQAFFSLEPQRQRSRQEGQTQKVGAAMVSTADISTAAKLWAAQGLPGSLSSSALPRVSQSRINSPGEAHSLPQTVANSCRAQAQRAVPTYPSSICSNPPSSQHSL